MLEGVHHDEEIRDRKYNSRILEKKIKNFVFLTDGDNPTHNVNILVSGIMFSTITLNTAGSTVSLLYTPLNIWSIIGGRIY